MVRVSTRLAVFVMTCLVAVSMAMAQDQPPDKKGKGKMTPEERKAAVEKRFDDMEKAVKHDPLTGVLTKEEFVTAMKEAKDTKGPRGKMAENPEEWFKNVKKADEGKITKGEFVTAVTTRGGRQKKAADGGGDKGT